MTTFEVHPGLTGNTLTVVDYLQIAYAGKRATKETLTEVLNKLYAEPADAVYRQTMAETGINPVRNDTERALTSRVTTRYTRTLLGGSRLGS